MTTASEPAPGTWFERGRRSCALTPFEDRFVDELSRRMHALAPVQVDPAQTALTSEPGRLYCLIPHRSLGGLTFVVALSRGERPTATIWTAWADIYNLHYHDDLDLANWIETKSVEMSRDADIRDAIQSVIEQLALPMTLRIWAGRGGAPDYAEVALGHQRAAKLGSWPNALKRLLHRERLQREIEVRFIDGTAPPFRQSSYAPRWFDYDVSK